MNGFNLSALAVRERGITLFMIIAVSAAGLLAFLNLGRGEDPSYTIHALTFYCVWPGATAQEMQDQVAEPLEKRMQELKWYDQVETFTRPGLAFSVLTLRDSMPSSRVPEEFYQARKKLADEAAQLPQGVLGPFVNDEYGDVSFALYALKARGVPLRLLVRQAENLRQRLLRVPGVEKVNLIGERPERIFVEFSYARLATLGISAREIFTALSNQNEVAAAGSIDTGGPQILIRLDGSLDGLQKIRDIPIVAGPRILKLSDLANVTRGYEDPPTFLIRNQGESALELGIVMKTGYNGLQLGAGLEREAASISADLPLGISFTKITDQAVNIREAYNEFMLKFFVALIVVIVVSLISLGWRVGIIVALAVPLTLGAVFVIMFATGREFDRITLGALILSLGLLVDDAIIVIEAMVVNMEEGNDRIFASGYAWGHTAAPMLAGTLLTSIGLMPVGFARSSGGEYAGNIFWVVTFALLASWVVAVTFTPYLGVKFLPDIAPVAGGRAGIYSTSLYRRLRALIGWTVVHKKSVASAVVAMFIVTMFLLGLVKKQFFPISDRPEVMIDVQMPEGASIEATDSAVAKVEAWLRKQPEARIVTSYIGAGAPRFYLALAPELPDPAFAKLIILTLDVKARNELIRRARLALAAGLVPEARVRARAIVFGTQASFPVAFRVMGPDRARVRKIEEQVKAVMMKNPAMRQVNVDWGERVPTAHFIIDQSRLRSIGLSSEEASRQLQFLLTGVPVTQIREDIRTVEVVARSAGGHRLDPANLGDFTLTGSAGQRVPVDQIGKVEIRMEDSILRRRDRLVTMTVRGDIGDQFEAPDVSMRILKDLQPIVTNLPADYRIETGGALEESARANTALVAVFPIMIVFMMIVIIFQVRSIATMVMVLLTAPLALIGVAPTLLLFRQPFGFNAILGLIGLAGIIMRNTLILIGQIGANQHDGLAPFQAVVEATVQRSRPVILTALAAVFAFIPLTLSVFWRSLAFTLIGGIIGGTALTLVFLPALYAIWFRIGPARKNLSAFASIVDEPKAMAS